MMKMKVVESTMVKPTLATPHTTMWLSNFDLIYRPSFHVPTHNFYRYDAASAANFFDAALLKAALSRALVEFYPVAGRLKRSENNRITLDCNGEGALFVEAEAEGHLDDFIIPRADVALVPEVDYSNDISTYPLLVAQMTRFACGGICLGIAMLHILADGPSAIRFINAWSDIARGTTNSPPVAPPFFDRTLLRARDPPRPNFAHVEYHITSHPQLEYCSDLSPQPKLLFSVFKLSRDQLNILKAKCNDDEGSDVYSTLEVLAAHIWRCVSMARGLPENRETRLNISVDGRSRLRPPLPTEYFGNAIFSAPTVASFGELGSNPLKYVIEKVHASLVRMDDEYMRSALDYLEVPDDLNAHARGESPVKSPNLAITFWARLPVYDTDFGWGRPIYVGLGVIPPQGVVIILRSPSNDGGLLSAISLVEQHMEIFENLFYDI